MKLSYEAHGTKVTIETKHDDVVMEEVYQLIQQLLLGVGFGSDTVKEYFNEE